MPFALRGRPERAWCLNTENTVFQVPNWPLALVEYALVAMKYVAICYE